MFSWFDDEFYWFWRSLKKKIDGRTRAGKCFFFNIFTFTLMPTTSKQKWKKKTHCTFLFSCFLFSSLCRAFWMRFLFSRWIFLCTNVQLAQEVFSFLPSAQRMKIRREKRKRKAFLLCSASADEKKQGKSRSIHHCERTRRKNGEKVDALDDELNRIEKVSRRNVSRIRQHSNMLFFKEKQFFSIIRSTHLVLSDKDLISPFTRKEKKTYRILLKNDSSSLAEWNFHWPETVRNASLRVVFRFLKL